MIASDTSLRALEGGDHCWSLDLNQGRNLREVGGVTCAGETGGDAYRL